MAAVTTKDYSINMSNVTQQDSLPQRKLQTSPKPTNTDQHQRSGNGKPTTTVPEDKGSGSPGQNEKEDSKEKGWGMFIFFIVIESTVFLSVMGLLISSLTVHKLHDSMFWNLGIWKWCLLLLAILCGRLIAYVETEAVLFLIWIFWLDEKVLYFAYGVKKSVMFFIWLSLVTLAWGILSSYGVKRNKDAAEIPHDVTKGLLGCLLGAALWLLKTLFVKLVGSLHATKLFEKIKEAIRLRRDLLSLSISNMAAMHRTTTDREKVETAAVFLKKLVRAFSVADVDDIDSEKQKVNKIFLFQERVHKFLSNMGIKKTKPKDGVVSTKTMIELINAIRGKKLRPLTYISYKNEDGTIKKEVGVNLSPDNYQKDIEEHIDAAREITDEAGAKNAANDIFSTIAGPENAGYVDLEELLKFVKDEKVKDQFLGLAEDKQGKTETESSNTEEDQQSEGHEQINTEQKQGKPEDKQSTIKEKHVKKSVFRNWVVGIYRDHDSLNNTLKHSKTAIDELNVIASVIVLFIITVMWLIFMGFISTKLLLFLSSQLLLVVFMFGNTVKTVFEAVIFVFVVHPFDVGDRCVVNGVQMVVDEMNILTTTFLRYDGEKIYYPNAVLATKPISNFYRSPTMMDTLEFAISLRTPMVTIDKLQEEIKTYLENNPRRWKHDHSVQFKEIEDVNKMKVALYVNHTINFQNIAKRGKRRSELVLEMKQIFEKLKIEYHLLPQQLNIMSYAEPTLPHTYTSPRN